MRRELTCIGCPMGCQISVEMENGQITGISGYTCKVGKTYAEKEVQHPTRIVTTSVPVEGSAVISMLPVKTDSDIPKEKIFDCIAALKGLVIKAPVKIGDVILENAAGTGARFVAAKNVEA